MKTMEPDYTGNDFMVAWNAPPQEPQVKVGPWPDSSGWSSPYMMTTGCCDGTFLELSDADRAVRLVYQAAGMMFAGVPPEDVLREFAQIRVWRDMSALMPAGHYDRAFIPGRPLEWSPHHP